MAETVKPTFIIGGAPRSGTTYLYKLLDSHEQIFMAKPLSPEPKFFLVDEEYQKGPAYYCHKYFGPGSAFPARGEKSTNYLESSAAAARAAALFPELKWVFILRDPVERAFSNYLWSRKNGLETLPFEEAIACEGQREVGYQGWMRYARPYSYVSRGFYATHLTPYLQLFGTERVRITILEHLIADPVQVLDELQAFLGVEPLPMRLPGPEKLNTANPDGRQMSASARKHLEEVYREPNRELARLVGLDQRIWQ